MINILLLEIPFEEKKKVWVVGDSFKVWVVGDSFKVWVVGDSFKVDDGINRCFIIPR